MISRRPDSETDATETGAEPTVLVVDDDRPLLNGIRRNLELKDCRVDMASDGNAAAEILSGKDFGVVVLDLQMQPQDGWFVLQKLRQLPTKPAVIVISGHVDVGTAVELMKQGVDEIFQKPFSPDALTNRVFELAQRNTASIVPPSAERLAGADSADQYLLGHSSKMDLVRDQIRKVARYPDMSVLLLGETGTGKEIVARAIHDLSQVEGRIVSINAAAMPEHLVESELFGHESGSFTGSRQTRRGLFEHACGGTLFLDEVGEMNPMVQAKLLRVLETRTFRRVGSNRDQTFSGRVVAATHRTQLGDDVGQLRPDIYYRLATFVISLPPLRSRSEDIGVLSEHFLREFSRRYGCARKQLTQRALEALHAHGWPGNIRELRAVVDRASVIASGEMVDVAAVSQAMQLPGAGNETQLDLCPEEEQPNALKGLERGLILRTFEESDGNVTEAARRLGIPRSTFRDKLRRFRPAAKSAAAGSDSAPPPRPATIMASSKP